MGFFSKLLGIDKARNAANKQLEEQRKATEQARADALAEQERVAAQQKAHNDALIAMQNNAQQMADANNAAANMGASTNVVAGGTADGVTTGLLKKKKQLSLSSSLGINV